MPLRGLKFPLQLLFHRIERGDGSQLHLQRLFAGVAHDHEHDAIEEDAVHGLVFALFVL